MPERRRRWKLVAQVIASAAFLALAIALARPENLWQEMRQANVWLIGLSIALMPALVVMRTARWQAIARSRRAGFTFAESFHSYMAGLALSVVTPWAAGELARGALAAPEDKASFVGLTFLDKVMDLTMLALSACAGFAWIAPGWYKAAALAAAAAILGCWAATRPVVSLLDRLLPRWKPVGAVRRALLASGQVPRRVLAVSFLLASANMVVYYYLLYLNMKAFSPTIQPEAAGLFPLITLSRLIPSVGGMGAREFVAGAIYARADYALSSAAAIMGAFTQFVVANVVPAALWMAFAGGFRRYLKAAPGRS